MQFYLIFMSQSNQNIEETCSKLGIPNQTMKSDLYPWMLLSVSVIILANSKSYVLTCRLIIEE